MRQRWVMAIAVAGLAGIATGCADRPNDLETYYNDPPSATTSTTSPVAPAPPPAPRPDEAELAVWREVNAARLAEPELAAEDVIASPAPPSPLRCLPAPSRASTLAEWRYQTGSTLRQQVIGYPAPVAADEVRRASCVGATEITLPPTKDVQAQRAWCLPDGAQSACVALLAKGRVVSGIQVTAASQARAQQAMSRLVRLTADALP